MLMTSCRAYCTRAELHDAPSACFGICAAKGCTRVTYGASLQCPQHPYAELRPTATGQTPCFDYVVELVLPANKCAGGCGKTINSGDWFCHMRPCYEQIKASLARLATVETELAAWQRWAQTVKNFVNGVQAG